MHARPVEWKGTLRDGTPILGRPIGAGDRDLERSFIDGMSSVARRFHFLDTMKSLSATLLAPLTVMDPAMDVAFVVLLAEAGATTEIGVARFSAQADGSDCELAIAVGDAWQRKGLGTLLMHHLTCAAQERGIAEMHAISASDNDPMRGLPECLGMRRMRDRMVVAHRSFIAPRCQRLRQRLLGDEAFECATAQTGKLAVAHTGSRVDREHGLARLSPLHDGGPTPRYAMSTISTDSRWLRAAVSGGPISEAEDCYFDNQAWTIRFCIDPALILFPPSPG